MRHKTSAILLAGGSGSRMQAHMPKQFLQLGDKLIVRHSFDLFMQMPEIDEIIVVCADAYQSIFATPNSTKPILFALPGARRQDSVFNGLQTANPCHSLICVHDGARPFIDRPLVIRALEAGKEHGAATVGMPVKFTVKEADETNNVVATPDRSRIWEIQTPQVVQRQILIDGFHHARTHHLTVTDDVSLAELIGKHVKIVEGSYNNLKITVPADLAIATYLLNTRDLQSCPTTSN